MNKKIIAYAAIPVLGISMFAANAASAHGFGPSFSASPEEMATHHSEMFAHKSAILGINLDEIKNAWAEGKSFETLAAEKGITREQMQERMKQTHEARMKEHLKALVDKGVITQAQADKRLEVMKKNEKGGGVMRHMKQQSGRNF